MVARTVARTSLNDLTPGAIGLQQQAATAREVEDINDQLWRLLALFDVDKIEGDDLDELLKAFAWTGLNPRQQATQATTGITLSTLTGPINVFVGFTVAAGEYQFRGTAAVVIPFGGSVLMPAQAAKAGTAYNVGAGTITRVVTQLPGVDASTNLAAVANGYDRESDDAVRARFKAHVRSLCRCTPVALEGLARTLGVATHDDGAYGDAIKVYEETTPAVRRVCFAKLIEDLVHRGISTLYIDDGVGFVGVPSAQLVEVALAEPVANPATGAVTRRKLQLTHWPVELGPFVLRKNAVALAEGTDYLLNRSNGKILLAAGVAAAAADVFDADFVYSLDLVRAVQVAIEGNPADRTRWPGWRAAGTVVYVRRPVVYPITVQGVVTLLPGYDAAAVCDQIEVRITAYINSLSIGENVVYNQLVEEAMAVEGVFDVQFVTPTVNVSIPDEQVARASSVILTA
jgi:uncharacterized phage protein gp47/JayE